MLALIILVVLGSSLLNPMNPLSPLSPLNPINQQPQQQNTSNINITDDGKLGCPFVKIFGVKC